jgi:ADP-dependent NAD(P)H-hydrate dehydratase / NAD(P)H-hydrate epimerase
MRLYTTLVLRLSCKVLFLWHNRCAIRIPELDLVSGKGVTMKVASVDQMKHLDRRATTEFGIPEDLLMENAGHAVYSVIQQELGIKGHKSVVLCGGGNNGGDGLVAARKIYSSGGEVRVFLLESAARFEGAARKNFEMAARMSLEMSEVDSADSIVSGVLESDIIVDAMFGTGLAREVGGTYRDVISLINESQAAVFSVDIPSGINGDTGEVMGSAVLADHTITFGLPKLGNVLFPGYDHCGKLHLSHISFPPALYDSGKIKTALNDPLELPERASDTHKGSYGKVLFIAGSSSYLGAPYFSALSFLKAGGGLAYLAAPKSISSFVATKAGEIVVIPLKETPSGSVALENRDELLRLSQTVDMVIIGPGLSLDAEAQELVRRLTAQIDRPLLIDGDGITAIAQDLGAVKGRKAATILTPHPGEMARIVKQQTNEIQRNRVSILQSAAEDLKATIVLKGAHSLIGYPDQTVFINVSGNPGMATAGSGDVLTGTIAAMYGLGLPLNDAVRTGVFVHGFSGDVVAVDKGEDGITAQDILDYLPETLKLYRDNFAEIAESLYGSIFVI